MTQKWKSADLQVLIPAPRWPCSRGVLCNQERIKFQAWLFIRQNHGKICRASFPPLLSYPPPLPGCISFYEHLQDGHAPRIRENLYTNHRLFGSKTMHSKTFISFRFSLQLLQ